MDDEVKELIERLKHPIHVDSFSNINSKISVLFGSIDIDEVLIDIEELFYILHIYRGRLKPEKFSIHIRLKNYYHNLVRIDINPDQVHINPDGSVVNGSHIHIYNNQYDKKDRVAIPINLSDFPIVENIVDAYTNFLNYCNIK